MPRREKPRLSDLENTLMSVIWKQGQATADVVRTSLESSQPLKDSTVRTILQRLEAKGYLQHRVEGRTYVYTPTVASRSVAADAVRSIIDRFCHGSVEDLLVGMVDREVVSPEQLRQLAQRIATQKSDEGSKPKGRARKQGN
jgi:BlaI family penicillinase repressor